MKKRCDICRRPYEPVPVKTSSFDEWASHYESSHIRVTLRRPNRIAFCDYDVCPACADRIVMHIKKEQKKIPSKCFFCEFDLGPINPNYPHINCKSCVNHCNFQVKKRMSPRQKAEWNWLYNEKGE